MEPKPEGKSRKRKQDPTAFRVPRAPPTVFPCVFCRSAPVCAPVSLAHAPIPPPPPVVSCLISVWSSSIAHSIRQMDTDAIVKSRRIMLATALDPQAQPAFWTAESSCTLPASAARADIEIGFAPRPPHALSLAAPSAPGPSEQASTAATVLQGRQLRLWQMQRWLASTRAAARDTIDAATAQCQLTRQGWQALGAAAPPVPVPQHSYAAAAPAQLRSP